MKTSYAVVGCGRLGQALVNGLSENGYTLEGIAGRRIDSVKEAANRLECDRFSLMPWEITTTADIVFITTPDDAIEETCARLAAHSGFEKNAVVLHCSGALPSSILTPAKNCGASIGSFHPLQSFAGKADGVHLFENIVVTLEGEGPALRVGKEMAWKLGANPIVIDSAAKTLYHASAVVASNYLVVLIDASDELIRAAGISPEDALKILLPLLEGTLSNVKKSGIPEALTGPIARGDSLIVENHLAAIRAESCDLLALYRVLGLRALKIASARRQIDETAEKTIQKILSEI